MSEDEHVVNFLEETERLLERQHKTWADVQWVGTPTFELDVENFKRVAKDVVYNSSYGIQESVDDILIVGNDWYMERRSYGGAERWAYVSKPKRPTQTWNGDFKLKSKYGSENFEMVNDWDNWITKD